MESETPHFNDNSKRTVNIPVELIPNLTEKEKHLFNSVGVLSNRLNDLDSKTDGQTRILEKILEQTTITNGKVKSLRGDVDDLKINMSEVAPDIKTIKVAKRVVKTKYFWIVAGLFFFVLLPLTYRYVPPEVILGKIVTFISGS